MEQQIWFDTQEGISGTEVFKHGTCDMPAKTQAEAKIIATQVQRHFPEAFVFIEEVKR